MTRTSVEAYTAVEAVQMEEVMEIDANVDSSSVMVTSPKESLGRDTITLPLQVEYTTE